MNRIFDFLTDHDLLVFATALGHHALLVVPGIAAACIGYGYYERRQILKEMRVARITVDELYQKQQAGENFAILDLRSELELAQDPIMIRGACHMAVDDVQRLWEEIPNDRDIVLYCSCPDEVTSARVTLNLRRQGIGRVRPLLGGIDAWRARNLPTDRHSQVCTGAPRTERESVRRGDGKNIEHRTPNNECWGIKKEEGKSGAASAV